MLKKEFRFTPGKQPVPSMSLSSRFFTLRYRPNELSHSRFALVVSKKIDSRATVRNRVKRLMHSCLGEIVHHFSRGYDIIFYIKRDIINQEQQTICQELRSILLQHRLIS